MLPYAAMIHGWCTGSTGASEEVTVPSNTITEISSKSSVVESHTEEHSESHRGGEPPTTTKILES